MRGVDLTYFDLGKINPDFDYYTPVIITSESYADEHADTVKAFLRALTRGYDYAIANPREAADILVKAAPEIDADLAARSLDFLSTRFTDDAPRWGEMKAEVWKRYADWLLRHDLISRPLDVEASFSNAYLP